MKEVALTAVVFLSLVALFPVLAYGGRRRTHCHMMRRLLSIHHQSEDMSHKPGSGTEAITCTLPPIYKTLFEVYDCYHLFIILVQA